MKKRSHANDPRRVTARERAHAAFGEDCARARGGRMIHGQACNLATRVLGVHARETLARERRRDAKGK